jgi:hypothetical protein
LALPQVSGPPGQHQICVPPLKNVKKFHKNTPIPSRLHTRRPFVPEAEQKNRLTVIVKKAVSFQKNS